MNWIDQVQLRQKKKNQVLFAKDSEYLQDLMRVIQDQDRKVLILWAQEFAAGSVSQLEEKYPDETRPREALEASKDWAAGKIKMRTAQRRILDCHAFAKELRSREDIALCHAIGQACSVVHTVGHAIGYPIYDLSSIVYKLGIENCREAVERRKQEYIHRLLYWEAHLADYCGEWAGFLNRQGSAALPAVCRQKKAAL